MKAVLMSVNKPHTDNIHIGAKKSELRTFPPNLPTPFKVYMYETKKGGGCGKVIGEWICKSMTKWLMYMGIPAHLSVDACVSNEHIRKYCDNGKKNITEMEIDQTSVKVYGEPKDLDCFRKYIDCHRGKDRENCVGCWDCKITRPPQNWCYVQDLSNRERR